MTPNGVHFSWFLSYPFSILSPHIEIRLTQRLMDDQRMQQSDFGCTFLRTAVSLDLSSRHDSVVAMCKAVQLRYLSLVVWR